MIKQYNDELSTVRKYKDSEMYLLPPSLFPNKPLDTIYQWYIFSNVSLASPLRRPLQINLYNDAYFQYSSMHIVNPSRNTPSCQLNIHLTCIYFPMVNYLRHPQMIYHQLSFLQHMTMICLTIFRRYCLISYFLSNSHRRGECCYAYDVIDTSQ